MVFVFNRTHGIELVARKLLRVHLVVFVRRTGTVVERSREIAVLQSPVDTVVVTHLHDVNLTAARPSIFVDVIAHHPVGRPQAVGCLGELYLCLHDAVLEGGLLVRVDTS